MSQWQTNTLSDHLSPSRLCIFNLTHMLLFVGDSWMYKLQFGAVIQLYNAVQTHAKSIDSDVRLLAEAL